MNHSFAQKILYTYFFNAKNTQKQTQKRHSALKVAKICQ